MADIPNGLENRLPEGEVLVSELGEVFAVLISMVMTVVDVIFALDLPDLKTCPKCPFMRGSKMKNHSIDFYRCETQRDFLETMWSPSVSSYWSLMSAMLAGCSVVVRQIASPVVMRLIKHTFMAAIVSLMWYVTEFQNHFESVSKLSAYVKAVLTVYVAVFAMIVIVGFRLVPRTLMKIVIICTIAALLFHLALSGYNLLCGRGSCVLSTFLAFYFFFVSKLAMKQEVPSHVSLVMCLLVVPPVCPMVVLLLCWCFDAFWTDLSDLLPRPTTPHQAMADTNTHDCPRLRSGCLMPSLYAFTSFR